MSGIDKRLGVIALGQFAGELPPLAPRLAALNVEPCRCNGLDQLPALLTGREVLLTELAWLNGLATPAREELARRAAKAAGWIALTDANAGFKDQVIWQRSGVSHFFQQPLDADRLAALIEDIHDWLDGPPVRVILVDDDENSLSYYAEVLRQAGIDLLATQDPLLVLDAIVDFKPDLLLLDIDMPACRGTELATMVRQRSEYARLPVIFLTAMDGIQDLLLVRAAAAEDFLSKPVAPELLVAAVKSHALRYRFLQRAQAFRRQQEAQARARLEQLRAAVDEHAIVSITDVKGNIVHVNDKFCAISGYSREKLLGKNHRMIKSDTHPPEFYSELWRTIGAGKIWHGEVCNRRENREPYWVDATIVPFLDDQGKPFQYISIRTDITALRQRGEELRVSDERLRRSQVFANIGTWDWNIQTGELFWSERIASLFGVPTGEQGTSYENFLNAVHPDDRQNVIDAVNACVERDVPYEVEHRVIWPDGTMLWLLEKGAVVRDAAGKALNMLGVVQDIHARKMAEAALAENEAFKQAILDSVPSQIAVLDRDGAIAAVNQSWRRFALENGVEPGKPTPHTEVGGNYLAVCQANGGASSEGGPEAHEGILAVLEGRLPSFSLEYPCHSPNQQRWFIASVTPLGVENHGVVIAHTNITDRKQAEVALIDAKEAAERANQAKSVFLSSMSHELRTPLNAILGFSQLMEYDDALPNEHKDHVQEILKGGRHLLGLINEVLDLAKIESGRIDLSLEPVELASLIEDCQHLIQPLAAARRISLRLHIPAETTVRADRVRLKQVLLNLLSNAVKYNREGGGIRLGVQPAATDSLRIMVTDTGAGIAPERMVELFQPFSRLDAEQSDIEGTGIGLTITRRLMELMGGEVGVDSQFGVGSTFWIELPSETTTTLDVAVAGAVT